MPIYAYKCEACGFAKDVLQKISEAPLTNCMACGQPALRKQVTAAGFQLKGSGWYATDFRDKGTSPPAAADKGAGGDKTVQASAEKAATHAGSAEGASKPADAPAVKAGAAAGAGTDS